MRQWGDRRAQTSEVLRKPIYETAEGVVMAEMTGVGERVETALRSPSGLNNRGGVSNTAPSSQNPTWNTEQLNGWAYEDDYTHLLFFHFLKSEVPNVSPHP